MKAAPAFVQAIEHSGIGEWMRGNVLAMPYVEAAHVVCITLVFGTILVVDLRLLGWRDRGRAAARVAGEMLHWTWTAFAGAVLTGALYFSANATTYWFNTAFRFKMLCILLAGVNMAVFHLTTWRQVSTWDAAGRVPRAARMAGALSILLWLSVLTLGRVIGFTKGYDFSAPVENVDFDFSTP